MRPRAIRSFFALSLIRLSVLVAQAQPGAKSPEAPARVPPEEIQKLVQQLRSDDLTTRETAAKAIRKIGDDALPHLGVVLAGAPGLELKRRAEALYTEIADKAPSPKLPDGVIHVKLPPGTFDLKPVKVNGKLLMRITVGKTIIETQKFYLGYRWGCTPYEVIKDEIHCWIGTLAGMTAEPGSSTFMERDYVRVDQLKPGSLLVTSPSFVYRWGKDAIGKEKQAPLK